MPQPAEPAAERGLQNLERMPFLERLHRVLHAAVLSHCGLEAVFYRFNTLPFDSCKGTFRFFHGRGLPRPSQQL
jgi:hypothetical protein